MSAQEADVADATASQRTAIGISFGNSNSSIAHTSSEGKAEVLANEEGDRQIPSILSYVDGEEYHGTQAKSHLVRNKKNTIAYFRDFLGKESVYPPSIIESYAQVFVVVDALDECPDGNGVLELMLAKLRSLQASNGINLLVTSRFLPKIVKAFKSDPQLEIRANETDVKKYLDGQMFRLAVCVMRNATLQEDIKGDIAKAANGMFLLAQLHMDSLTDKMSIKDVRGALKRLPNGGDENALEKAYSDAMERINAQQTGFKKLAIQVLSWITYAKRELTQLELQHALAIEPEERCLDPENLKDVKDMVSVCAGLVTIEQETNVIRLVHYTTQEYLQRIHLKSDPHVQQEIAARCLAYLLFDAFDCGYCESDAMLENLLSEHPLLDYAAKHWGHYACWDTDEPGEIKALALDLLRNESKASVSGQIAFLDSYRWPLYSQLLPRVSGIHLCAFFGLKTLMMALLNGITPPNVLHSRGRTPLLLAASNGDEAVVKLLVDRDDVAADSKDNEGWTPLLLAASSGHKAVVKLLVDRDDGAAQ